MLRDAALRPNDTVARHVTNRLDHHPFYDSDILNAALDFE